MLHPIENVTYLMFHCELRIFHYITLLLLLSPVLTAGATSTIFYLLLYRINVGSKESFIVIRTEERIRNGDE